MLPLSQWTSSWPRPGVVAGDGSLVAGPEPGVRVVGVLKGDPVAALEPAAHISDLADPGEDRTQLGLGRPGPQALPVRASVITAPAVSITRHGPERTMMPVILAPG